MAKRGSSSINFSYNSVAIEDELNSITQNITQEVAQVRGFSTTAPERVVDGYDYNYSLGGTWDGAASQGDATLFGGLGAAAAATAFDPTGATAGTDDPNYDATAVLASYSITGSTGAPITYSATLEGSGTLTRATS